MKNRFSGEHPASHGVPPSTQTTVTAAQQHDHSQGTCRQLRRRRAAALRCPPLADGRRDPLSELDPLDWIDPEQDDRWRDAVQHLKTALGVDVGLVMVRTARRPGAR